MDLVDAALGALTGLIALAKGHSWVGDADEGALLLPVSALPKLPLGRLIDKPLAERAPEHGRARPRHARFRQTEGWRRVASDNLLLAMPPDLHPKLLQRATH